MKIFTAIEIPPQAVSQIQKQTESLYKDYPSYNWVPAENYHVSLYYIGDIIREKLPIAVEHIQNALYDIPKTEMYTFGTDLFMNEHIVVYVSFRRNKLVEEISDRIYNLFEESTKRKYEYIPHLTLARTKIPSKQQYFHLKKKLSNIKLDVEFAVKEIHIYESIAMPKNPVYKKVASIPLLSE